MAAFYVVLFHGLPWLRQKFVVPRALETFLGNGYLAVTLFFILSGFILAYTYDGQIDGKTNRLHFWEARFARIYPVYFLSLMLAFWFERGLSLGTRLAVLGMVQAWDPRAPQLTGAWNYPAWTLSVEAFFYLCFPFLLPWMSRKLSTRVLFSDDEACHPLYDLHCGTHTCSGPWGFGSVLTLHKHCPSSSIANS